MGTVAQHLTDHVHGMADLRLLPRPITLLPLAVPLDSGEVRERFTFWDGGRLRARPILLGSFQMGLDASRFVVGDEWVYRARDDAASERVRILAVTPKKNSVRLDVAFVDDPAARVENVPGNRLRALWSEVDAYDALMANWRRIDDRDLDDTEEACVEQVYRLLIPEDVADIEWSPVSCATAVHDEARLGVTG